MLLPGSGYILASIFLGSGAEKSVSKTLLESGFQEPISKG